MWAIVWQLAAGSSYRNVVAWPLLDHRRSCVTGLQIVAVKLLLNAVLDVRIRLPSWLRGRRLNHRRPVQPLEVSETTYKPAFRSRSSAEGPTRRPHRPLRRLGHFPRLAGKRLLLICRRGSLANRSAVGATSAAGRLLNGGSCRRRACWLVGGLPERLDFAACRRLSVDGNCPLLSAGSGVAGSYCQSADGLVGRRASEVICTNWRNVKRHDCGGWPVEIARSVYFFLRWLLGAFQLRLEREWPATNWRWPQRSHRGRLAQTLVQVVITPEPPPCKSPHLRRPDGQPPPPNNNRTHGS